MKRFVLAAALPLLVNATPSVDPRGNVIDVTISGIRSDAGRIRVEVCPEKSFLSACPWSADVPARRGVVSVSLRDVPPGRYAVQAFQDANANGKLDQGIFGIPKEGIGFSNDAMAKLTRPRFSAAAFDHAAGEQHIAVTLRYFLG